MIFLKKKATQEDFETVDKIIDLLAPNYDQTPEIQKARRAWGRILLTYGDTPHIEKKTRR